MPSYIKKLFFIVVTILLIIAIFLVPINSGQSGDGTSLLSALTGQKNRFLTNVLKKEITITIGGDIMLGRTVMTKSLDQNNPVYPFELVGAELAKSDLTFVNLENPVVEGCKRDYESLIFCSTPEMLKGVTASGIDIVNLANNHTRNYGESGFQETLTHLEDNGIDYVGLDQPVIKEIAGMRIGFLGFNFLDNIPNQGDYDLIANTKSGVDILIVSIHWGVEYTDRPTDTQRTWAREIVTAGADVIAGHHPHWIQEIEFINGKPVYYSLGNLVFDQMWSEKTKEGLVVELTFKGGDLIKEERKIVYMSEWARPEFVNVKK